MVKSIFNILSILAVLCCSSTYSWAQNQVAKMPFLEAPMYQILDEVEALYGVKVLYHPDELPSYITYLSNDSINLYKLFQQISIGTNLKLVKYSDSVFVVAPENLISKAYAEDLVMGWRSGKYRSPANKVADLLRFKQGEPQKAEDFITFSGQLTDAKTKEALYGATLYCPTLKIGTSTDIDGNFSFKFPSGIHYIEVRLLGYLMQPIQLEVYQNLSVNTIGLEAESISIAEVVVRATSAQEEQTNTSLGIQKLSARKLESLPSFGGELNILQALSYQPGITAISEGSSGISVRGGGLDQNLVLQNGTPVLYPAHALGFFPLFNPYLVSGLQVYKGFVPSRFSGRSSAVIDVGWKSGDYKRWKLKANTGFFASSLGIDGPILKDKVSLIVGGRFSHMNMWLRQIRDGSIRRSKVNFEDLSAKISSRWNTGSIEVSGSFANDFFRYSNSAGYDYQNIGARALVRQTTGSKSTLHFELYTSSFNNSLFELRESVGQSELTTGLRQYGTKARFTSAISDGISYDLGIGFDYYDMLSRKLNTGIESPIVPYEQSDPDLQNSYVFGEASWEANDKINLTLGLRISQAQTSIPSSLRNVYEGPTIQENKTETRVLQGEENYQHDIQIQPRLGLSYAFNEKKSLAFAYSRLVQPIHQLSTTISPSPADIFFASSEHIPLNTSDGVSLTFVQGATRTVQPHGFEFGLYYRRSEGNNIGRSGDILRSSAFPEIGNYTLNGESYGVEFSYRLKKRTSTLDLSYTWGRSWLFAAGNYPEFALLNDRKIRAPTDIPHQININYDLRFSDRTNFSLTWLFTSGRVFTAPDGQLPILGAIVPVYGQINAARLAPNHRLDLNFTVDPSNNAKRGAFVGFGISFYNMYMRENPFLAFFRYNSNGRITGNQFSLIGDVIPALNLTLTWK